MRLRVAMWVLVLAAAPVALAMGARAYGRAVLYPAPHGHTTIAAAPVLSHATADRKTAHALNFSRDDDLRVVVWFHGNGENAENAAALAPTLRLRGLGSVFVEYRGYGVSRDVGSPTEAGLYADGEAILDALQDKGIGARRVILVGHSLGSGVATEMAVRDRGRALVVLSPFASVRGVAARIVPMAIASFLFDDNYDSLSKATQLRVPLTVVHGTDDEVVPFAMGKELAAVAPHGTFVPLDGAHHGDIFLRAEPAVVDAIVASGNVP